jgi:hypothetical protein
VAVDGLGLATNLRIDASPVGDTTIFGEVRYSNTSNQRVVQAFQGSTFITTCDCLQDIEVRFKGVPLGSAVEGSWQTSASRDGGGRASTGPKGLSLHIGLNHVDPDHYDGWDGELRAAENDAHDMQSIAKACGYRTQLILSEDATSARVLQELATAIRSLAPGDIFLLTYAGHGSQIPDVNGDEDDELDETWLLFDRMFSDDELYATWGRFKPGVRVVMVSDSCHSGTMARDAVYRKIGSSPSLMNDYGTSTQPVFRVAPDDIAIATYTKHQLMYDSIAWSCADGDRAAIAASVITLSGCQDNQTSADGRTNGKFTEKLKEVWHNGFDGNYYSFVKQIKRLMPKMQSPNYFTVGRSDHAFEESSPFSIQMSTGANKHNRGWDVPEIGKDMLPRPKPHRHLDEPWAVPSTFESRGSPEDRPDPSSTIQFKYELQRAVDDVCEKYRR